jgi:hypothetical protein
MSLGTRLGQIVECVVGALFSIVLHLQALTSGGSVILVSEAR